MQRRRKRLILAHLEDTFVVEHVLNKRFQMVHVGVLAIIHTCFERQRSMHACKQSITMFSLHMYSNDSLLS